MDLDSLGGEPFHPAGEAEAAAHAGQRAEPVPQQGPGAPESGETLVVVGFAVMDVEPHPVALAKTVIEVASHLRPGVILEQLGIGPLHAAFGEQVLRGLPRPSQTFEEKQGFGILLPHPGRDVAPGGHGDFVAGVAAETIHATAAPGEENLRQVFPELRITMIQLGQVFPGNTPGTGADKGAVRGAQVPLWMRFLERGTPARMVGDHIQEDPPAAQMSRISQFAELIHAGRAPVEFDQCGINAHQVKARIRTPEPSHPRIGGGGGIDRQ